MTEKIQAVKGMNDVLPLDSVKWHSVEQSFKMCMKQYGYEEIRMPLVENTQLFKRSIGDVTDIVEKEMYCFTDLNGESIALRPEGTAGCIRACLEHGLLHNQQQKLWYMGPMFRHEKPQKGRYRQFTQFGVEALGIPGLSIELELLAMCHRLWQAAGIDKSLKLEINTLGEFSERQVYKEKLVGYLNLHIDNLDEDCKRRLTKNPLRILDSKNPAVQAILCDAPKLLDHISLENRERFNKLCNGLDKLGIEYEVNPFLVRGLDYYGHTVFEWLTDKLGSQATVCAGGRYDALIGHLGGHAAPAFGFALGIERVLLLIETLQIQSKIIPPPSVFMMTDAEGAHVELLSLAERLRDAFPLWTVFVNTAGGSFKSQFKKADKSGASFALIFGEDELKNQTVSVKNLREDVAQHTIPRNELIHFLKAMTGEL